MGGFLETEAPTRLPIRPDPFFRTVQAPGGVALAGTIAANALSPSSPPRGLECCQVPGDCSSISSFCEVMLSPPLLACTVRKWRTAQRMLTSQTTYCQSVAALTTTLTTLTSPTTILMTLTSLTTTLMTLTSLTTTLTTLTTLMTAPLMAASSIWTHCLTGAGAGCCLGCSRHNAVAATPWPQQLQSGSPCHCLRGLAHPCLLLCRLVAPTAGGGGGGLAAVTPSLRTAIHAASEAGASMHVGAILKQSTQPLSIPHQRCRKSSSRLRSKGLSCLGLTWLRPRAYHTSCRQVSRPELRFLHAWKLTCRVTSCLCPLGTVAAQLWTQQS